MSFFWLIWKIFRDRKKAFCHLLTLSGPTLWVFCQAWEGLRGPDAKNWSYHQPIEMNFGKSYWNHKSMPIAKSGSLSSFGDMTSENFHLKKKTCHWIRIFTPGKWFLLEEKMSFCVHNHFFPPKVVPPWQFQQIFKQTILFLFSKFLRRLDKKREVATPLID